MSYRLSDSIRVDVKNLRAAGDEVEVAVKNFFKEKLFPNYYVGDGHIVDKFLKVSSQYDLIISESRKNPILFSLADKSDLFYYEPVYVFAEIKRSFYKKELLTEFATNIIRLKSELSREPIAPNYVETGGAGLIVGEDLTSLPLRNPIFSFMIFVSSNKLKTSNLKDFVEKTDKAGLPNFIVFLDQGLFVNVNSAALKSGKVKINLYPEYEEGENEWILLAIPDNHATLTYQYMMVLDHLNSTVVGRTDVLEYTSKLFNLSTSNVIKL